MKRDYQRSNFTLSSIGAAIYCYADEQREMIRRIVALPEHHEALRLDAMCRGGAPTAEVAAKWADVQTLLNSKALAIVERVLAESEADEAAGRRAVLDGDEPKDGAS